MKTISKPPDKEFQANEEIYAKAIPNDGLLLDHLLSNFDATKNFILSIPADKLLHRYAEGKWTIKEIVMHLIDMERIYSYRALRFARNDQTILPGFDADKYILHSGANERDISDLLNEFEAVRHSTIALLNGFAGEALLRTGVMNGHPVSVRALAYHIAGHELHHVDVIKDRYL
jgi:uncharacterized damage-inducible protein DinB